MVAALEKEIRLSFAARIRGTLPEDIQPLISEAKEQDTPAFKYNVDGKRPISTQSPGSKVFQEHHMPIPPKKFFASSAQRPQIQTSKHSSLPSKRLPALSALRTP